MIIDFHTHVFPDHIAFQALEKLQIAAKTKANTEGTVSSLLQSMDNAGIDSSVICSIATRPGQFDNILQWSEAIQSPRIIPLPSIHPDEKEIGQKLSLIKQKGFAGIKIHPYYQDFFINEARLAPVYESLIKENLLVVMHTGYDIAFDYDNRVTPLPIAELITRYPELKLVTTHFGAWSAWDEVEKHLIGKPVYIETSLSLQSISHEQAKRMFQAHPPEFLIFGSDSPWEDQKESIARIKALNLGKEMENRIFSENARRLLESCKD